MKRKDRIKTKTKKRKKELHQKRGFFDFYMDGMGWHDKFIKSFDKNTFEHGAHI